LNGTAVREDCSHHMGSPSDDRAIDTPAAAPRSLLGVTVVAVLAIACVGAAVGFVGFLSQLRGAEAKPSHTADGIVVLTGGSSRVSDALELLAGGYGKRLLRRSRPLGGQYPQQRGGDQALGA